MLRYVGFVIVATSFAQTFGDHEHKNGNSILTKSNYLREKIISVKELLEIENLCIPSYQRPYKWTERNLNQLLEDFRYYRDKEEYRLGTIVFHHDSDGLNIVDGQQRTLTLFLLVKALLSEPDKKLERESLKNKLKGLKKFVDNFLNNQEFNSDISHQNIYQNYQVARRAVSRPDFTEDDIEFLLEKCQFVTFELSDISEAFQFFDSQNSRGLDLEPHDLLKAFHLREFPEAENDLKAEAVRGWESMDSKQLAGLFARYLFRIRNWSQGKSARYFTKAQVDIFKGVNIDQIKIYPYAEALRITHAFIDEYNSHWQRKIVQSQIAYPFQLDERVINGRRFFEMVGHYQNKIASLNSVLAYKSEEDKIFILNIKLEEQARNIINTINTYGGWYRTGDRYVRDIFNCALIFYIDKFGTEMLSQAIEKLFIWAYKCRLEKYAVQLATIDNYVIGDNVFERIKEAVHPAEFLNWSPKGISENDIQASNVDEIKKLFKEMKYNG